MAPEPHIAFGPFRLGLATPQARLWHGEQALTLRARSLAVLRYLVEHPGRLVTKTELRQHVWAGMHVTDTVLRVCIRDIRVALDDAAAAPQYLETVGGQGYRWLVQGERSVPLPDAVGPIMGRQREVDALEGWFQRAAARHRGGQCGAPMNGYSKVFNVEANPREAHNIASQYAWGRGPLLKAVEADKARLPQHPNPPAAHSTHFLQLYLMELGQEMHPRRHVDTTDGGVVFPV